MWNFLYDYLVQLFAGLRWSAFLAENNNNLALATKMRSVYRNDLYQLSGMVILLVTLITVLFYYFVINRKGGSGYGFRVKYWLITLAGNSLTLTILLLSISMSMTRSYSSLNPFKYTLALGFSNLIYSVLLFIIFSVIFKRFSVANTTPF